MSRGYNINRYGSQEREEDRRMIPRPAARRPQEKTDAQRTSGSGETPSPVQETAAAGQQFGTESGAEE